MTDRDELIPGSVDARNEHTEKQLEAFGETWDETHHLELPKTSFDLPDNRPEHEKALSKTWKGHEVAKQRKFDDATAHRFLILYAATGMKTSSAKAAGVSYSTIYRWEQEDDDFAALLEEARQEFLDDVIHREMMRRGFEGILKPIVAGKDPKIVTYERVYSDKFVEMMAKKFDREGFGNRDSNVNVNVKHGVMAIPAHDKNQTIDSLGVEVLPVKQCSVCYEEMDENDPKCMKCGGQPIEDAEVITDD